MTRLLAALALSALLATDAEAQRRVSASVRLGGVQLGASYGSPARGGSVRAVRTCAPARVRVWVPGHWVRQWVAPRWETRILSCGQRTRVLARAGHWAKVWRPGHYELRTVTGR